MWLYGASGHAKVIIDILTLNGVEIDGLFDDNKEITNLFDYKVCQFNQDLLNNSKLIISIGNNKTRKKLALELKDFSFSKAIHPLAIVDNSVFVDAGSVIMAGSVINNSVKIGNHSIVNTKASIDHDCILGSFVHVAPGVTVCGGVQIGEGSLIGAGSTIIPNIKIGEWAVIGAGSVIKENIPNGCKVVGVPGRIVKS